MSWLLNLVRFAEKFPFKCPHCQSTAGAFRESGSGLSIFCQDCGAAQSFTRETIEKMLAEPKALPK